MKSNIDNIDKDLLDTTETIITPKGASHTMSLYEMARWCCLIEAVQVIDKFGSQKNIPLDNMKWEKPIAIQKYIDERTPSMIDEMEYEMANPTLTL